MLLYVFYFAQPQIQMANQHRAKNRNSCLPTRIHPAFLKKITEDILHKIYIEKGAKIGI